MSIERTVSDGVFTDEDIPFNAAQCSECGVHAVQFGTCTVCGADVAADERSSPEIVLEE